MHALLGKNVPTNKKSGSIRVCFLRADCDRGIAGQNEPYFLIRLSDQSVIREVLPKEDFDKAVKEG